MKSPLASRTIPQVVPAPGLNIRRFNRHVEDGFNKLCFSALPPDCKEYEVVNFLATVGELKAFQPILTGNTFTHCFFEYHKAEDAETCLARLPKEKFKGRPVNIKRAALMGEGRVGAGLRAKGKSMFEKDIHSHFLTFDTVGFFQTMKISCVLVLRNVINSPSEK